MEEPTKKQLEIAKFITDRKLDFQIKIDDYLPLINAIDEYAQVQVKKLNIDDVSISLECEDCGGSIDDEDVFCKHCGDEILN